MTSYHGRFSQSKPQVKFHQQKIIHLESSFQHSNLFKSNLVHSNFKFVKYDSQGNTTLVQEPNQLQEGFSYKKICMQEQNNVFPDIDWKNDILKNNKTQGHSKIVMRSLRKLYEKNYRPQFFTFLNQTESKCFKYYDPQIPDSIYQMDHLSRSHIKSLFITQDYSQDGLYEIVINQNGRFKIIKVNDLVPVQQQTNQHIWGVEQPWRMILLKVWACINQGYLNLLLQYSPFSFMEYFTSNNWKYYNLQRQKDHFIDLFKNKMDICYIVLQTKNSPEVQKMGLIPYNVCYNVISINQPKNIQNSSQQITIEVKSRFKHKWQGQLNLIKNYSKVPTKQERPFRLEKNFILTKNQFFNMFGCAYITSLSKSNTHITDFYKIKIPARTKNATYLRFRIKQKGFLDFSFIQPKSNKIIVQNNKSLIDNQQYQMQMGRSSSLRKNRYLKCKYMLIKSLQGSTNKFQSKLSRSLRRKQPTLTSEAKFEAYEMQFLRGYNKGQAHYMLMQPGEYYFRLKSQVCQQDSTYYLNYCASQKIQISQQIMSSQQKSYIFQNCMISLIPAAKKLKTKTSRIYSGDLFETIGYGFLIVQNLTKAKTSNNSQVLTEINFTELRNSGYELKGKQYKGSLQKFAFKIDPEQYLVLIFKKIQEYKQKVFYWPPNGIDTFRSKDLKDDDELRDDDY